MSVSQVLYFSNPIIWMLVSFFWMWIAHRIRKENFQTLRRLQTVEMWVMLNDRKLNPTITQGEVNEVSEDTDSSRDSNNIDSVS